jgi:hypothetical protein
MKKIIFGILLLTLTFILVQPTHAIFVNSATPAGKINQIKEKIELKTTQREAKITGIQERKETNLRERATKEIERRITSLNGLIAKINAFKKLTESQKSAMVSQIQTEITNLTNLKAKILADVDDATLKTDVQSIVKGFRIYAFFVPKIHVLAAADALDNTAEKMSSLSGKLETRIAEAKAKGLNTATLDILLTNLKAKISDAKLQAQTTRDLVISLTPDGYPNNKTILQSARTKLVAGHKDLQLARQDAMNIIIELKKFNKESNPTKNSTTTSTESTTTTTTP